MLIRRRHLGYVMASIFAMTVWARPSLGQLTMGTAFTYQGSLKNGGSPASGQFSMTFKVYDQASGANAALATVALPTVQVTAGLFSASLDFGSGIFDGSARWLGVTIGTDPELTPRVPLTPAPYALFAATAENANKLNGQAASAYALTSAIHNQPPVAIIQAKPSPIIYLGLTGTLPSLTLDLGLSSDPEGQALTYGFDPTGQSATQPTYGAATTTVASYDAPADYVARGWVKDASGAISVSQCLVSVKQGFKIKSVDVSSSLDLPTTAIIEGEAAIAYNDGGYPEYIVGGANGLGWGGNPINVIDQVSTVLSPIAIGQVGSFAAAAYADEEGNGPTYPLRYARATAAEGGAWASPVTVDNIDNTDVAISLAVVNGKPSLAYHDVNFGLKFSRSADATGSSWGSPVTVDSSSTDAGYSPTLLIVSINPAIAYYDYNLGFLQFVRANDANGATWGSPISISPGDINLNSQMVLAGGNPAIAFTDATAGTLMYVRATNATGSNWGAPVTLDPTLTNISSVALALVDGNPAIFYFDNTINKTIKFIRATDVNGTTWGSPMSLDVNSGDFSQAVGLPAGGPGLPLVSALTLKFIAP